MRPGCQHDRVLVRTLFLVCRGPSSPDLTGPEEEERGERDLLCVSSYKGTNLILKGLHPPHLPKAPPPKTITLGGKDFNI